jgi:hypothetical protein
VIEAGAAVQADQDRAFTHGRPVRDKPSADDVEIETHVSDLDKHAPIVRWRQALDEMSVVCRAVGAIRVQEKARKCGPFQ